MKYIILPVLKFIWALILTIGYSLFVLIYYPILVIWTFKIKQDFEYSIITDKAEDNLFPYWRANSYVTKKYTFKSYYHLIWNIK